MRKLLALMSVLALAACVYPSLAQRQAYLAQFIGVSETDLVRTLGVPTRTIDADSHHFLAYVERTTDVFPAYGWGGNYWNGYYGTFYGPPIYGGLPQQVIERVCETTFELQGGKVQSFSLRGNACG